LCLSPSISFGLYFLLYFLGVVEMRQDNKSLINVHEQGSELKLVHNPTFRREAGAFGSWD